MARLGRMDFDHYRCAVCWETFNGPGELADHEQAEQDRRHPIDGLDGDS